MGKLPGKLRRRKRKEIEKGGLRHSVLAGGNIELEVLHRTLL